MPFLGEHSARINPPNRYVRTRRQNNKFGNGIHAIFGILSEGGSEVKELRFDADKFTLDQVAEWLHEQDYKALDIDPAVTFDENQKDAEELPKTHRFLAVPFAPENNTIQEVNGGLMVPGVRLLAPGTWTDSTSKTPCRYTEDILKRHLANWSDLSYWSRHGGGTPRDITDRIADIQNVRYQDGVVADLFFHGATSKSQDAIALVKAAQAGRVPWPYSSVEMMTRDRWIISEKLFEATEVEFTGAAMVNQGACRVCKIRNNEAGKSDDEAPAQAAHECATDNTTSQDTDTMTDTKELEGQIAALQKELETLKAAKPEIKAEIPKELTATITTLEGTIKDLSSRLEKIEKAPGEVVTAPAEARELETPKSTAYFDRKTGVVRSF